MVIRETTPLQQASHHSNLEHANRQAAPRSDEKLTVPHFVVLQHGVHGSVRDMRLLKGVLKSASGCVTSADATPHHFVVFDTDVIWGLNTHAGIDECTAKLLAEMRPALVRFLETVAAIGACGGVYAPGPALFSCVGHSFGGILLRELVYRLVHQEWTSLQAIAPLELHAFVSVSTPHLGVRYGGISPVELLGRVAGKVSRTVAELRLSDANEAVLANGLIDAGHVDALSRFRRRLLIASVNNDLLVSFQTATLQPELTQEQLRDLASENRVTEHCLATRTLEPQASTPQDQEVTPTEEQRIARALRSAMRFDVLPVVSDAWVPNAHGATVSKWGYTKSQCMDDVSVVVAQYLSSR